MKNRLRRKELLKLQFGETENEILHKTKEKFVICAIFPTLQIEKKKLLYFISHFKRHVILIS